MSDIKQGQIYRHGFGLFIVARVSRASFALIALDDGSCWTDTPRPLIHQVFGEYGHQFKLVGTTATHRFAVKQRLVDEEG